MLQRTKIEWRGRIRAQRVTQHCEYLTFAQGGGENISITDQKVSCDGASSFKRPLIEQRRKIGRARVGQ
jgi:hypothetical protein